LILSKLELQDIRDEELFRVQQQEAMLLAESGPLSPPPGSCDAGYNQSQRSTTHCSQLESPVNVIDQSVSRAIESCSNVENPNPNKVTCLEFGDVIKTDSQGTEKNIQQTNTIDNIESQVKYKNSSVDITDNQKSDNISFLLNDTTDLSHLDLSADEEIQKQEKKFKTKICRQSKNTQNIKINAVQSSLFAQSKFLENATGDKFRDEDILVSPIKSMNTVSEGSSFFTGIKTLTTSTPAGKCRNQGHIKESQRLSNEETNIKNATQNSEAFLLDCKRHAGENSNVKNSNEVLVLNSLHCSENKIEMHTENTSCSQKVRELSEKFRFKRKVSNCKLENDDKLACDGQMEVEVMNMKSKRKTALNDSDIVQPVKVSKLLMDEDDAKKTAQVKCKTALETVCANNTTQYISKHDDSLHTVSETVRSGAKCTPKISSKTLNKLKKFSHEEESDHPITNNQNDVSPDNNGFLHNGNGNSDNTNVKSLLNVQNTAISLKSIKDQKVKSHFQKTINPSKIQRLCQLINTKESTQENVASNSCNIFPKQTSGDVNSEDASKAEQLPIFTTDDQDLDFIL
jgi:hypothetical protein